MSAVTLIECDVWSQMAEEDVKRADFDRENKLKESKVVAKAARIKRAELNDLERLLARSVDSTT